MYHTAMPQQDSGGCVYRGAAPGTFRLSRLGPPGPLRSGRAVTGTATVTWMESKFKAVRRAWKHKLGRGRKGECKWTDLGVGVDLKARHRGVKSRDLGDVVVLPLSLLLLQLEGDAADGALLDTLHEMGGEAGDFVAQPLRGYYRLCVG